MDYEDKTFGEAPETEDLIPDSAILKAALLAADDFETEVVPIKRKGKVIAKVTIRGLSRHEALACQDGVGDNVALAEQRLLSKAMVNPRMTEKEVARWQATAPAHEMDNLVSKVNRLSGMDEEAMKEAMKAFRNR